VLSEVVALSSEGMTRVPLVEVVADAAEALFLESVCEMSDRAVVVAASAAPAPANPPRKRRRWMPFLPDVDEVEWLMRQERGLVIKEQAVIQANNV
jgi:hypothetical protein